MRPIGDIHFGSIQCDEDAIEKEIGKIKEDRNSLIIGMGDYADAITKNDKRFDIGGLAKWVQPDNIVESERRKVVELFKPVQKKILLMLTGNHEEVIHLAHDNDITRNIVEDLDVPYGGYSCFLNLTFHRQPDFIKRSYLIHCWHGSGAAQTDGARLNRLMRLVNEIQADIYLMGHLHAIIQHTPDRLVYRNGKVKSIRLAATITGSWLKSYAQPLDKQHLNASYSEMRGFIPTRIGGPVVHIDPDTDTFTIES